MRKPSVPDDGTSRVGQGAVRSMTGFANTRRDTPAGEITVSLRSVNHRSLDLHFHSIHEFAIFENDLRELLKRNLRRGHVEVRLGFRRDASEGQAAVDRAALHGYVKAFRQIAGELGIPYQPDLHALLGLRGVMTDTAAIAPSELPSGLGVDLMEAAESCVAALNEHREREGAQLRAEMRNQATLIAEGAAEVRAIRHDALPHFHARLHDKLREMLAGSAVISETRLAEEAALLADRSDIDEELVRLGVHTTELVNLLNTGGEVGKRLDFLLQEMNREVNTLLAKSAGAGAPGLRITTTGLAIKASIERIREQALNLE